MSELEDKLNSLLSDPAGMAQVVQLAQQLSSTMGASPPQPASNAAPGPSSADPTQIPRASALCWVALILRSSPNSCRCCNRSPQTKAIPCSF